MAELGAEGEAAIQQYGELRASLADAGAELQKVVMAPQHSLQFLRAGRIVAVRMGAVSLCQGGPMVLKHEFHCGACLEVACKDPWPL